MTLYQKLKASGNPQAPIQTIVSLLENRHSLKETARIVGVSERWVYRGRHRRHRGSELIPLELLCLRSKAGINFDNVIPLGTQKAGQPA